MRPMLPRIRVGPLGFYWFLTFETSPELHSLARACQAEMISTSYDLAPVESLHLTLDRIAHSGGGAAGRLDAIEEAARRACRELAPFDIAVGPVIDIRGAVGFAVSPALQVHRLREILRAATLFGNPEAPIKSATSDPHVTIAYPSGAAKSDALRGIDSIGPAAQQVNVTITEVLMVFLERNKRSYSWQVVTRIPLSG